MMSDAETTKFNAKVMLVQGLRKDWLTNLEDVHMSKLLKFLCVKNSKYGLMCIGGMWQRELDGGPEVCPSERESESARESSSNVDAQRRLSSLSSRRSEKTLVSSNGGGVA